MFKTAFGMHCRIGLKAFHFVMVSSFTNPRSKCLDQYSKVTNLNCSYCLNFKIFGLTMSLQHNNVAAMKQIILVVRTRMGQMV
ncbi:hypothetical protein PEB0150_012790 [Bartonella apis]|nr:hypothetical protein PEB0150_012790 [Bartonella apis]